VCTNTYRRRRSCHSRVTFPHLVQPLFQPCGYSLSSLSFTTRVILPLKKHTQVRKQLPNPSLWTQVKSCLKCTKFVREFVFSQRKKKQREINFCSLCFSLFLSHSLSFPVHTVCVLLSLINFTKVSCEWYWRITQKRCCVQVIGTYECLYSQQMKYKNSSLTHEHDCLDKVEKLWQGSSEREDHQQQLEGWHSR
jgi:hypothetical protein